jgi:hypothetical protein
MQRLFHSPPLSKDRSSLHLHDAIVSPSLDHLTIKTRWPKESSDDFLVKSESRLVKKLEGTEAPSFIASSFSP